MGLNYDYSASKAYCAQLGLVWLGDDWVAAADREAGELYFNQSQVDAAMRHHLWQIKVLFTPSTYKWTQRVCLAFHFLFGRNKL